MSPALASPARAGGSVAGHARDGMLSMRFGLDPARRTVLKARAFRFPLRTTVAFRLDESDPATAFVYVQNPTGGVFAGDVLDIDVVAERETRVHVTGQSATKLARSPDGRMGRQDTSVEISPGAFVELMPDTLIPHAGARYHQRTTVQLGPDAVFMSSELLAPGRSAETYAYTDVTLSTRLLRGPRELAVDTLALRPTPAMDPMRAGVFGARAWLGSLLVAAPERDTERLAALIDAELAACAGARGAAGLLPDGCGVGARILATDGPAALAAIRGAWRVARRALLELDLPPLRKA